MKKLALVCIVSVSIFCFAASAFAGSIAPGQSTSCKNAGSITLAVDGSSGPDRTNGNAVIWKSSNYTTVPITLGPGDNNSFGEAHAKKVGMANKHKMGQKSVTLKSQNNFSRGDSIGNISGEVKITNTGTIPIAVTCG
jgi:hypothetical protein